jgi:hypothetical protein
MSTVPEGSTSAQVVVLALTLTSYQRSILAKAGEARWFDLPHPWLPLPGSQEATARALAEGDEALLAPVVGYLSAYELTSLGERVAALFLLHLVMPDEAVALAQRLTPLQRSVLSQVAARGSLTLAGLSTAREGAVAYALTSAEYGVLSRTGSAGGCFTVSPLGVQVLHLLAEVE